MLNNGNKYKWLWVKIIQLTDGMIIFVNDLKSLELSVKA